jgi:hypothetical protein
VFVGIGIRFDVHFQSGWIPRINAHLADAYGNLKGGGGSPKDPDLLLRIAKAYFRGSVHDELGRRQEVIWLKKNAPRGISELSVRLLMTARVEEL